MRIAADDSSQVLQRRDRLLNHRPVLHRHDLALLVPASCGDPIGGARQLRRFARSSLSRSRLANPWPSDIGGVLYGKYMRWMILFSIVLSQVIQLRGMLSTIAAYSTFHRSDSSQPTPSSLCVLAFAHPSSSNPVRRHKISKLSSWRLPTAAPTSPSRSSSSGSSSSSSVRHSLPPSLPGLTSFAALAMIRNIQKLSGTALIADAFILFGLVYIFSNEIKVLADNGLADVKMFNSKDFPLLIGYVCPPGQLCVAHSLRAERPSSPSRALDSSSPSPSR